MIKRNKKENAEKQWLFFYTLLQSRGRYSEISNLELKGDITSMWFHHIYPKSKYPELRFCPENIIIINSDEHNSIELGSTFPELEKRKKIIAENYENLVKDTEEYIKDYLNPVYEHVKQRTSFFKKSH